MKQKKVTLCGNNLKTLFETDFPQITSLASASSDISIFKDKLNIYLTSENIKNENAREVIKRLISNDGKIIYELSTEKEIKLQTITLLYSFLRDELDKNVPSDLFLDLYHQLKRLHDNQPDLPSLELINQWMKRWPSGLNESVKTIREHNKKHIISLLVKKIENRNSSHNHYSFDKEMTDEEKMNQVYKWWNDYKFHLAMAVKTPTELNRMLNNSLSRETLELYDRAKKKEMPIFITPYYLSLLNPTGKGYNDAAIRTYILYSEQLVDTYGSINAWEKEDKVEENKPNAAGWLLPDGHNIHRRYPEVAILIPDSMGRACGGLCASCQRMYDFQSKRLNFNLEDLKPKESWDKRLRRLMEYFENDTQLRDILITGGDALMSQNKTLKSILEAVCKMAVHKKKANLNRADGEKYAEIQRVRLGTRLPVYLPMRINDELIEILKEFRQKGSEIGIRQFIIQTHFQTPLEVTPEARDGIRKLIEAGWTITNQLVYNVAASRRGHTVKLRKVLNEIGVLCYYTFSVKGFNENYAVFTPNSRSIQEQMEEKIIGKLSLEKETEFLDGIKDWKLPKKYIQTFCKENNYPFLATDRNVLNLPGIGKSMTFETVGITETGQRILSFDHDHTRLHSPIIKKMEKVYIKENKSIYQYLLQLEAMGENLEEYASVWNYTEGVTEPRSLFYTYPEYDYIPTSEYSNLGIE